MKISRKELNECIAEAMVRVLKEDKIDDLLNSILMGDKKGSAAAKAAGGDLGLDLTTPSPNATGKRGRPKKDPNAKPMDLTAQDNKIMKAISEVPDEIGSEEFDAPDVSDEDDEEENVATFDMNFSFISTEDLKNMSANKRGNINSLRKVTSELKRRKTMRERYLEDGIKPDWGYIYNKETDTIEPDPRHAGLGEKHSNAWNADNGYDMQFKANYSNWNK